MENIPQRSLISIILESVQIPNREHISMKMTLVTKYWDKNIEYTDNGYI